MVQEFVKRVHFERSAGFAATRAAINARKDALGGTADFFAVFLIDDFFDPADVAAQCGAEPTDVVLSVNTAHEPTTKGVDEIVAELKGRLKGLPEVIVAIGGGITLDTGKAVSNLLANGGNAADFQGWDLLKRPGVFKLGLPTISGTGAESSRTCVLLNPDTQIKLGMNSVHTLFDEIIIDSDLTATVPDKQYFYTGMDTYLHCVESLQGRFRNPVSDLFAEQALVRARAVFSSGEMSAPTNRESLALASYLGGVAIAGSFVGVIHPVSAALSSVLGIHHCEANCIAMRGMEEFYPAAYAEFWEFADANGVSVRSITGATLGAAVIDALRTSMLVHERPLANALGDGYRDILTDDRIEAIFRSL
jgi:3-deoxy-alpha-D-manno-octulosonate 8-oxidase